MPTINFTYTMELKDYSTCSSAESLFKCCCQNAMKIFMDEQRIAQPLRIGHYLYHNSYHLAISDKAMPNQIFHAYMEIERYCHEHHDCEGELTHLFSHELLGAIAVHGQRIHENELRLHGRVFYRN